MSFMLCNANGRRADTDAIAAELAGMGYPMSLDRVEQIDVHGGADFGPGHEHYDRVVRDTHNARDPYAYIDWEGWDHHAYHTLNTARQRDLKNELLGILKARGIRCGIWADPALWRFHDRPLSGTSLYNFRLYSPRPDFLILSVYITEHLDELERAVRFAHNVHYAVRVCEQQFPGVEILHAHQPVVRPHGGGFVDMTDSDAWQIGRLVASTGKRCIWWHEDLARGGVSNRDRLLGDARRLAPAFMDGMGSIGIELGR